MLILKWNNINFSANLDQAGGTRIFFILEEAKETIVDFLNGTVRELWTHSIN